MSFDISKLSYDGIKVLTYLALRAREVELRGIKDKLWSPLINEAIEELFEQLAQSLRACVFKNFFDDNLINRWLAIHYLRYPNDKQVFDALYTMLDKHWINPEKMYYWREIAEGALVPFLILEKNMMKPHFNWWVTLFGKRISLTITW